MVGWARVTGGSASQVRATNIRCVLLGYGMIISTRYPIDYCWIPLALLDAVTAVAKYQFIIVIIQNLHILVPLYMFFVQKFFGVLCTSSLFINFVLYVCFSYKMFFGVFDLSGGFKLNDRHFSILLPIVWRLSPGSRYPEFASV